VPALRVNQTASGPPQGIQGIINVLTKDLGTANAEVATDVLLPSADAVYLAGLAFRVRDINNLYLTRIFHIHNGPTIEVEIADARTAGVPFQ
jgi:hypothetical protein